MLNRFLQSLLIPLLAFALLGPVGGSREVLEEEHPAAVSTCSAALTQIQCRRAASDEHRSVAVFAATVKQCRFSLDRLAVAVAPHGRADNTRGDPLAA